MAVVLILDAILLSQISSGSESGNDIAGSVADINKHSHFPVQKLNLADIRALIPTELANKSLLVLSPEAALCAACGIAVSFALPSHAQRCC